MGVPIVYLCMFLREKKNSSGRVSIQSISKSSGKYKVVKTIGNSSNEQKTLRLTYLGKQEIERISCQPKLFVSENDTIVDLVFSTLNNANIRTVGPEIIFGKIYDNKGYNKYLKLTGDVSIEIDYEKFNNDQSWDGLKGYISNTNLKDKQVIENYKNLWFIEKAFRMSKTDLRIRPIYHRLKQRIEAHICISFTAYCIYKELERVLYKEKSALSLKKSAELTHNMYQITYTLPESKHTKSKLLKMDDQQAELFQIIQKNF